MPTVNGKKYPYTPAGKAAAKKAASKSSYVGNVFKEVKQTAKSASNAVDKYLNGNRPLPKGMKIGSSNVKAEVGQLAGAVLQGRRYDASGKQIVAGKGGSARRTAQSTSRTRTARGGVPAIQPKGVKVGPKTAPKIMKKGEVKPRGGTPASKAVSPSVANAGRTRSTGTPMPRRKVSPNANRPPLNRTPMPKKVSPNANRPSYRGGPLR